MKIILLLIATSILTGCMMLNPTDFTLLDGPTERPATLIGGNLVLMATHFSKSIGQTVTIGEETRTIIDIERLGYGGYPPDLTIGLLDKPFTHARGIGSLPEAHYRNAVIQIRNQDGKLIPTPGPPYKIDSYRDAMGHTWQTMGIQLEPGALRSGDSGQPIYANLNGVRYLVGLNQAFSNGLLGFFPLVADNEKELNKRLRILVKRWPEITSSEPQTK